MWSSPRSARTPPFGEVPEEFACLKASPDLSTPGPFPYHIPNIPSLVLLDIRPACCEPHTAVAARSSFKPELKFISLFFKNFSASHKDLSYIPSGDPRYPEIKAAVFKLLLLSLCL